MSDMSDALRRARLRAQHRRHPMGCSCDRCLDRGRQVPTPDRRAPLRFDLEDLADHEVRDNNG